MRLLAVGSISVVGRAQPVVAYEVIGRKPMNTHAPKRIPCVTFEITDLLHQWSASGVLTIGFSQIAQGAGFTARRCPVAPPKRGPGPAPRRALRLDDPLVATPLIAGSERTHLPMCG